MLRPRGTGWAIPLGLAVVEERAELAGALTRIVVWGGDRSPRAPKPAISKRSKTTPRAPRSATVVSRSSTSNAIWVDAPDGAPAELNRWNSVGPHT